MTSIEKWGNSLAFMGIGLLGAALGSKIPGLGMLRGAITGSIATLSLLTASGCGEKVTYAVNHCPNGTVLPVTFEIDCSEVGGESKDCKTYLDNTACNLYPAFQKITQLSLTNRCPSLWYGIYPKNKWRMNVAGFSTAPDCKMFWLDTHSTLSYEEGGVTYDAHELLHQIQFQLPEINSFNHSLFVTTVLEAQRLGDPLSYPAAVESVKMTYEDSLAHPEKVKDCFTAQTILEEGLYFKDTKNIYKIYNFLNKSKFASSEIALSSVLYVVSGKDHSVQKYLLDHGCTKF